MGISEFWKINGGNGGGFRTIAQKFTLSTNVKGEKVVLAEVEDYREAFDVIYDYLRANEKDNPVTDIKFFENYISIETDYKGTAFAIEPLFVPII